MRRSGSTAALAAALLLTAATDALAQPSFEGIIAYEMNAAGMSMNMEQTIKGTRVRQEVQMPSGAMINIVDTETMDMTMIMPAQKMYMKMNAGQMMAQLQAAQGMEAEQPDPADLQATGRTETIAGHSCEHYTWSSDKGEMDMCIATGIGFMPFATPSGGMGGRGGMGGGMGAFPDAARWRARFSDGFVPLAMTYTAEGNTMTMRATRVEPGSVPDSAFAIPEGFTEMRMPGGPPGR